jgi:hypothetical protein
MSSYEWMELQTLTAEIAASRARLVHARSTRDVGRVRALEEEISAAETRRDRLLAHITTNLVATPEPPPLPRGRGRGANAAQNATPDPGGSSAEAPASTADEAMPAAEAETSSALEAEGQPDAAAASADAPAEQPAEAVDQAVEVADQPVQVADQPPAEMDAAETSDAPASKAEAAEPESQAIAPEAIEPSTPAVSAAGNEDGEFKSPEPNGRVVASDAATPAPAPRTSGAQGGINVWDQLKPSDIERAKQELETRREEMLARHAEEVRGLEADRAQLDTLEQAIATFLQKFSGATGDVVALDAEREARQQA